MTTIYDLCHQVINLIAELTLTSRNRILHSTQQKKKYYFYYSCPCVEAMFHYNVEAIQSPILMLKNSPNKFPLSTWFFIICVSTVCLGPLIYRMVQVSATYCRKVSRRVISNELNCLVMSCTFLCIPVVSKGIRQLFIFNSQNKRIVNMKLYKITLNWSQISEL